jgi:hypothetical protein
MGLIGGKRVVVPIVTGAGVLSKQPSRLPPRSAVMCLEDTNVTAQKDNALQDAQQIPAERCADSTLKTRAEPLTSSDRSLMPSFIAMGTLGF